MIGQHTPGSWTAHKHGSRSLAWRVTLTPGDAHGDLANVLAGLGARNADEVAANARMMAASPDLYEALKAVVSIADRKTDEFDRARAAIAKAEGRTP